MKRAQEFICPVMEDEVPEKKKPKEKEEEEVKVVAGRWGDWKDPPGGGPPGVSLPIC